MNVAQRLSSIFHAFKGSSAISFYSTMMPRRATGTNRGTPWQTCNSMRALYLRIANVANSKASIVPILDQWVHEGGPDDKEQFLGFIMELRFRKRYFHALEICKWMNDKRYFELTPTLAAIRLDLIGKVHGLKQAEDYFNNLPIQLKVFQVYGALLHRYSQAKDVQNAEAVMQKMRHLGFAGRSPLAYNCLLTLYYQTANHEKFDLLMHEMEEEGISFNCVTFCICLSSFAAQCDVERVKEVIEKAESDSQINLDWNFYSTAAAAYTKAGLLDKAEQMLKKSETLISDKRRGTAYGVLLTQYAGIGRRDEVLRLWEMYKKNQKVYTPGYMAMLNSLLKFDDIETAEEIYEEWLFQTPKFDIRLPNYLLGFYSRKGLVEKAETLVNKIILRKETPDARTWYYLATAHLQCDQGEKAVEAMKEAIGVLESWWKPEEKYLLRCLKYLKEEGDIEGAEEFIKLLQDNNVVPIDAQERFLSYIKDEQSNLDVVSDLGKVC